MKTNKTEKLPIRLPQTALSKNLSNIAEDFELEEEIRLPQTVRPKKKITHTSDIQLQHKLKRIIANKNKSMHQPTPKHSFNTLYKPELPSVTPVKTYGRTKSVLDKILERQDDFSKNYFEDLQKKQREKKREGISFEGVDFTFPSIRIGAWQVVGMIKENHILLKGTHKDSRVCIKKYEYKKVYAKMRKDYQSWVDSKFCFET